RNWLSRPMRHRENWFFRSEATMTRFASLAVVAILSLSAPCRAAEPPSRRWVYLQLNMQVADNIEKAKEIMRRAKDAGYNGVVMADFKLNILDRVPDFYFRNVAEFKKAADELGLEVIPTVCSIGYS